MIRSTEGMFGDFWSEMDRKAISKKVNLLRCKRMIRDVSLIRTNISIHNCAIENDDPGIRLWRQHWSRTRRITLK